MSNTQEYPHALICGNSRCAKQLAGYVPFCPYCGTTQPSKTQEQAKTEVEQLVNRLELEPLEFDHETKRTEDAERLKAEQASKAAKEKAEQQANEQTAAEDKIAANAKAVRERAEQADATVAQSVPSFGPHNSLSKSTQPSGLNKKSISFLLLVGCVMIFMALKSTHNGRPESLPAQENAIPTHLEKKIKQPRITPEYVLKKNPVPAVIPYSAPPEQQAKRYESAPPEQQAKRYEPASPVRQAKRYESAPPVQQAKRYESAPPVQQAMPHENEKVIELLGEARKYIAQGNYKGAEEEMKFCAMIDSENQACQQIKQKAALLNNEMFDCVGAGKEWVDGRCN